MSLVYVFSVNSSLEALYELDNEGNVEKPIHMTGNYPMGTFLSCAIEMLTQWRNDGYSILNCDTLLSVICDRYVNTPSSYGSALRSDSTAKAFLGQLLNMSYFVAEHKKSIEHLDDCLGYVDYCIKFDHVNTVNGVRILAQQLNRTIPKTTVYTGSQFGKNEDHSIALNQALFAGGKSKRYLETRSPFRNRPLFELPRVEIPTNTEQMQLPIYIFDISDIIDLVLSSMFCIFEKKYMLYKCEFCKSIFVRKDHRGRYCPPSISQNGCQGIYKLKKQIARDNAKESSKVNKRIRTMLSAKKNVEEQDMVCFREESRDYRRRIQDGRSTEEAYINWMNKYWEDIKRKYNSKR